MAKRHTFTYICEACTIVFQTFGLVRNGKPYCPNCGDFIDVRTQQGIHSMKEEIKNLKTKWTEEELEILQRCVNGKIAAYQVSIMTGRSKDSVHNKLKRMKKK